MTLLHIDSSITGAASVSRALSAAIVERLTTGRPDETIIRRDLHAEPLPYFDLADRSEAEAAAAAARGQAALEEFLAADTVVIGAPMYNFGVPAQLKTWIDWLAIPGATFAYTERGPAGLCEGKRIIVASSRGNTYGVDQRPESEHQESHLRAVFALFGVPQIEVYRAEGVRLSPQHAETAMAAALDQIAGMGH